MKLVKADAFLDKQYKNTKYMRSITDYGIINAWYKAFREKFLVILHSVVMVKCMWKEKQRVSR